jgi:hypothetical protein
MWILIILAVHLNNPKDIPGRVMIEFHTLQDCERARSTMTSWLKFDNFKVVAECKKQL